MGWKPFPYLPLSGTDIRYVTVHPSNGATVKVRCTLHQAPLENVDFDAVSYAWGDPSVTETIILSGKPFRATTNLVACLKQLATRADETILWVDAICINQNDVDERNAQVRRMKNIYSAARSVIAWLGSSTRLSRIGVQRLQSINPKETKDLQGEKEKQHIENRGCVLKRVLDGEGEHGLRELLLRSYWCRTWVIQEIALGQMPQNDRTRLVYFLCGEDEIPFSTLWALASLLVDHNSITSGQPAATAELSLINWSFTFAKFFHDVEDGFLRLILTIEQPIRPLQELLSVFRSFKCSDPRDRIYALLSIASDAEGISPDYNKPTATVYSDVVRWLIGKHDSLDILSMACYHSERDFSQASWIPDWRYGAPDAHGYADKSRDNRKYSCSKGLPVSCHPWSLDSETGQLYLSGACLDTVTHLSKDIPSNDEKLWTIFDLIFDWATMVHVRHGDWSISGTTLLTGFKRKRYPFSDEPLAEACRRTLVADSDNPDQDPVSSGYMLVCPGETMNLKPEDSTYVQRHTDNAIITLLVRRRLAITSQGWIGWVQKEAEVGDHVAVLIGSSVPFVLRKAPVDTARGRDNEYTLIGDAYIHGLMHGKGLDMAEMSEIILC